MKRNGVFSFIMCISFFCNACGGIDDIIRLNPFLSRGYI